MENRVVHSFEIDDIEFLSYPSWVPGDAGVVNEECNSGNSSVRLDYIFKEAPETQPPMLYSWKWNHIPDGTKNTLMGLQPKIYSKLA